MVELRVKGQRAHGQYQERDVWIEQEVEDALLQGHLQFDDGSTNEMEGGRLAVKSFHRLAVDLLKQIVLIASHVIDEVLIERFLVGPRLRFAYRGLGQSHIASPWSDERAHEGGSIVFKLLLHDVIQLLATKSDRMSGPCVGSRSHRRHVGSLQDKEACRGRPRA